MRLFLACIDHLKPDYLIPPEGGTLEGFYESDQPAMDGKDGWIIKMANEYRFWMINGLFVLNPSVPVAVALPAKRSLPWLICIICINIHHC